MTDRIYEDEAMVASISARGGVQAALGYYGHLGRDDYYTRGSEPPGGWAGEGAARLSLAGPVTRSDFEAALKGIDPQTGERLVQHGGKAREHVAGWDVTFSAPKSVSVLWALSDAHDRPRIGQAQKAAVAAATKHIERSAAFARRGKGGMTREPAAGLLMATFDHHTSRDLDPQLHTHAFVFNLAPRKDGTWGAIVSRELYKAQKQAGAIYREALAAELERAGYAIERAPNSFRVAAIPRNVERAFSKRRQSIEAAAEVHGYRSPKGMELAALRTRQAKRDVSREQLFKTWRAEAKALGFELSRTQLHRYSARDAKRVLSAADRSPTSANTRQNAPSKTAMQPALSKLGDAVSALDGRTGMPGMAVDLSQRERVSRSSLKEYDRG